MEAKSTGLLDRISQRFFRSSAVPSTTPVVADQSIAEHGENPPRLGDLMVTKPAEEIKASVPPPVSGPAENIFDPIVPVGESTAIPHVTIAPSNPAKRKRTERPDLYDVPEPNHEAGPDMEEQNGKPAKRPRRNTKAKTPLVAAKKSNGQRLQLPNRQTRNTQASASAEPEAEKAVQSPTKAMTDKNNDNKRSPGRPRKPPPLEQEHNGGDISPTLTDKGILPSSESPVPGETEGISEILLNPSPIKVARPATEVQPSKSMTSQDSDDGLPDLPNIGQQLVEAQGRSGTPEEKARELAAPKQPENKIIDSEVLKLMLETANHVGHKFNERENQWELVRKPKLFSKQGKTIARLLEGLVSLYTELRDFKATKNLDAIRAAHVAITDSVHSLKKHTERVLTERLGNPARGIDFFDAVAEQTILIDLYFNIFPNLLMSMVLGADAYADNGNIHTSSLKEFEDLVEVYYRLATTAIEQPKRCQPRPESIPSKGKSLEFQIQRPTRLIIPLMRDFRKIIKAELSSRAQVEKAAERSRLAPERERIRQEKEQTERREKRRRVKQIHRKQREDLARQLADPIWGDILRDEISRAEAAAEAKEAEKWALGELKKRRARRTQVIENQEVDEEDFEADPFQDDPFEQRVSIFGKNNNQRNGSQPWSDKKRTTFVDFLRLYSGIVSSLNFTGTGY